MSLPGLTNHHRPIEHFGMNASVCPFCASKHLYVYCGRMSHVECVSCGAEGPQTTEGPESAVDLWNQRRRS